MGRAVYEALFENDPGRTGADALVAALARRGRIHRAAMELAQDEMDEGLYAVEEEEDLGMMRYAADDRSEQAAAFSGGDYRVDVRVSEEGVLATQVAGPPGASLKIDGQWVVLNPNQAVALPLDGIPEQLLLVDYSGRERVLTR